MGSGSGTIFFKSLKKIIAHSLFKSVGLGWVSMDLILTHKVTEPIQSKTNRFYSYQIDAVKCGVIEPFTWQFFHFNCFVIQLIGIDPLGPIRDQFKPPMKF